jgi:hypothetical protein
MIVPAGDMAEPRLGVHPTRTRGPRPTGSRPTGSWPTGSWPTGTRPHHSGSPTGTRPSKPQHPRPTGHPGVPEDDEMMSIQPMDPEATLWRRTLEVDYHLAPRNEDDDENKEDQREETKEEKKERKEREKQEKKNKKKHSTGYAGPTGTGVPHGTGRPQSTGRPHHTKSTSSDDAGVTRTVNWGADPEATKD